MSYLLQILHRNARKLEPTEAELVLGDYARRLLALHDEAQQVMRARRGGSLNSSRVV